MIRLIRGLALAALVFELGNMGAAYGQYAVTGATAGGGKVIVGSGTSLGELSTSSTPVALSAGGFDHVTLNAGSMLVLTGTAEVGGIALPQPGDGLAFTTSNNIVLNNGTILVGGATVYGGSAYNAIGFSGAGISGETVTNNGSADGGSGFAIALLLGGSGVSSSGGNGIGFDSTGGISGVTVSNNGRAAGGTGGGGLSNSFFIISPVTPAGDGGAGGSGIGFISSGDMTAIHVANGGSAIGGAGGGGGSPVFGIIFSNGNTSAAGGFGGNGGDGIAFTSGGGANSIFVTNSGSAAGGNGGAGGDAIIMSNPISVFVTGTGLTSFITPLTFAGSAGGAGGNGGAGIGFNAAGGITLVNVGTARGGDGNTGGAGSPVGIALAFFASGTTAGDIGDLGTGGNGGLGGTGGNGISFLSSTGLGGITVTNNGVVTGGNGGTGGVGGAVTITTDGTSETFSGSNTIITTGSAITLAGSAVSGESEGGMGGNGGVGGNGISVTATGAINGATITNNGSVTGGNGGAGGAGGANSGTPLFGEAGETGRNNSGGDGIFVSPGGALENVALFNNGSVTGGNGNAEESNGGNGVIFTTPDALANITVTNHGSITGGNGRSGGNGIQFGSGAGGSNLTVNNFGNITGGNDAPSNNAGAGIASNAGNLVINNWGVISTGTGNRPAAINLENSSNNVVNLDGRDIVNGLIKADGNAGTNVLNLNFSGLTPAQIAGLKAQLVTQGVLNGVDSSGSFTLRGETYAWDPMVVHLNATSYQLQAVTPNQLVIAILLDGIAVNPPAGSSLANLLNGVDQSGNVPAALDQLSPQKFQIFGDIALADANFLTLNIDQRLNNLRDGSEGIDTTGIGGDNTVAGWTKDDSGGGKEDKGVIQTKTEEKHWGFFGSGDVVLADIGAQGSDLGHSRFTSAGLVLGLDGKVNENLVLGSYFSYQYTSAGLDDIGSKANVSSYGGGLYAGYHNGGYYGNGLLGYTRNNYDTMRAITLPGFTNVADGSTHGDQFMVNLDGGRDFKLTPAVTAGPIAGLQYVHLGVEGFDEANGGAADLAVGDQEVNSLRSRLGFRIDYHRQIGREVAFAAEARAEWQHEFLDDSRSLGASFIGDGLGGFSVQTTGPQRDAALVGGGLNVTIRERLTIFADYDVQAGQSSYFEQSVRGGVKISW